MRLEITTMEEGVIDEEVTLHVKRRPKPYYYLTDHPGTIRSTVCGGSSGMVYNPQDLKLDRLVASGTRAQMGFVPMSVAAKEGEWATKKALTLDSSLAEVHYMVGVRKAWP